MPRPARLTAKQLKKTGLRRFEVYLSADEHERIRQLAHEYGASMSWVVRRAVSKLMKSKNRKI